MNDYTTKYQTAQSDIKLNTMLLTGSVFIALIALCFDGIWIKTAAILAALLFLGFLLIAMVSYRVILLYEDRVEVSGLFGGNKLVVKYSSIRTIGLIDAEYGSMIAGAKTDPSLIILLNTGERKEFDAAEFDHLTEVYAFIQERTNL